MTQASNELLISIYDDNFHLELLHGNFLAKLSYPELREPFLVRLHGLLDQCTEEICMAWMHESWRQQTCASWFASMLEYRSLTPWVEERLLASRICFAGEAHAIYLAVLGDERSSKVLVDYLEEYLPMNDRNYDQLWVVAALQYLDAERNESNASRFVNSQINWFPSKISKTPQDPTRLVKRVAQAIEFCRRIKKEREQRPRNK